MSQPVSVLVCVKRVPDITEEVVLSEDGQSVDGRRSGFTMSAHEECAVELAVQVTGAGGGVATALTIGDADVSADYYISALPAEIMAPLVTDEIARAAPSIAAISKLRTAWMNGIQFFLERDVPVVNGHTIYIDSPWALTSISQRQFWRPGALDRYGNGKLGVFA